MKPENIELAEELDFDGPISSLLNRAGKRIVGCTTQAIWNLITVIGEWPKDVDPMDGLMTIQAGIKEDFTTQGANHRATIDYLKSEPIIAEQFVDVFLTEDKSSKEILHLLKDHVILLFSYGVESMPNQGHLGLLHMTNKRLWLDGTEIDIEVFCQFLFSSKQNHALLFKR